MIPKKTIKYLIESYFFYGIMFIVGVNYSLIEQESPFTIISGIVFIIISLWLSYVTYKRIDIINENLSNEEEDNKSK